MVMASSASPFSGKFHIPQLTACYSREEKKMNDHGIIGITTV
jgi:hypothetical protein